jgi:predicted anti-sigma-YlaC factor YlaD
VLIAARRADGCPDLVTAAPRLAIDGNIPTVLRDYRRVDCEVAREALSARLDGEREPVPSGRVDEHLEGCAACRAWFDQVADLARDLHQLVQSRRVISPVGPIGVERALPLRRSLVTWQRWALLCVGIA